MIPGPGSQMNDVMNAKGKVETAFT